jgi:hypothetical protein
LIDRARGEYLLRKACDGGAADGCLVLGQGYLYGTYLEKDYLQAENFFIKAYNGNGSISKSFSSSMLVDLAIAYSDEKNEAKAASLYKMACDLGNSISCDHLQNQLQELISEWTWTDPATGLMWTTKDNGTEVSWQQAATYCQRLRLADYGHWRLPAIDELSAIYVPAFPGMNKGGIEMMGQHPVPGRTWSNSAGKVSGDYWSFDLSNGRRHSYSGLTVSSLAVCVRDPKDEMAGGPVMK